MPPISDELDEELPSMSSADETLDVAAVEPEGDAAAPAKSSDATGDNADDGALSVVREVVDETRKSSTAASPAEGEEAGSEAGGTASNKEPDDDKFTDVPFHKHPRFQALIQQRDTFKVDAVRYQNVQTFLDNSGMSADEAANGLTVMARAKTDPAGAWAEIKPWVQKLLVAAGEVLPDDLQARVASGDITQDAAFELSRSRAQISSVETRTSFEQQQRERGAQTQLANTLVKTADDWTKDRQIKDPSFKAKEPLLMREIAFLQLQEGKPRTAEGVSDQLKRAYASVNKTFVKPAAPSAQVRRPAIKPVVGGTVAGSVRDTTTPKSTLDIVRAGRRAG